MERIEIGDNCYGSFVIIDGESISSSEQDERGEEYSRQLKLKMIGELSKIINNLSSSQLKSIAEMIACNSNDWEFDEDLSGRSSCDQCGSYNYREVYNRVDNR